MYTRVTHPFVCVVVKHLFPDYRSGCAFGGHVSCLIDVGSCGDTSPPTDVLRGVH